MQRRQILAVSLFVISSLFVSAEATNTFTSHGTEIERGVFSGPSITVNVHDYTMDSPSEPVVCGNVCDYILENYTPDSPPSYDHTPEPSSNSNDHRSSSWEGTSSLCDHFDPHDRGWVNSGSDNDYRPENHFKKARIDPKDDQTHPLFGFKQIWPDSDILGEEVKLWKMELDYTPISYQKAKRVRCNARHKAYEKTSGFPYTFDKYYYKLSNCADILLTARNIDKDIFLSGMYNPLQHQLHTEFVSILNQTAQWLKHPAYCKEFWASTKSIAILTTTGVQSNKIGDVIKTAAIADFCWQLFDCGQAVIDGVAQGIIDLAVYAKENPHEMILLGLAPEAMAGYYTLKLIYNVGCVAKEIGTEGPAKFFEGHIKDATIRGTICSASALVTRMYLNGKLDRQLVKYVGAGKNALIESVQRNQPKLSLALNNTNQLRFQRSVQKIKNNPRPAKSAVDVPQQQAKLELSIKQIKDHKAFITKLSQKMNRNSRDKKVCFKKILPNDPQDLEKMGWKDVTDPRARANSAAPRYRHSEYEIEMRFDKGKPNMPGYEGKDHYQIYNPLINHHRFGYLDLHGKVASKGSGPSHILLKDLKNNCSCERDLL